MRFGKRYQSRRFAIFAQNAAGSRTDSSYCAR